MANLEEIERLDTPHEWPMEVMRGFGGAFVSAHEREIELRVEQGCVRDCHGDLRSEHVLLGPPARVVDRIEFDPTLRRLDVGCDLAFLTMDLEAHRRHAAAQDLLRAYRQAGGSPGSDQLRHFYGAYWALVRAKVALIAAVSGAGRSRRREEARARRLWKLAERLCWRAHSPVAIVVCGSAADATPQIVAEQFARFEALSEIPAASALVLDTEQELDAQVAKLASAVNTRMLAVRSLSGRAGAVSPVVERQAEA